MFKCWAVLRGTGTASQGAGGPLSPSDSGSRTPPVAIDHFAVPSAKRGMIATVSSTLFADRTRKLGRFWWSSHVHSRPSLFLACGSSRQLSRRSAGQALAGGSHLLSQANRGNGPSARRFAVFMRRMSTKSRNLSRQEFNIKNSVSSPLRFRLILGHNPVIRGPKWPLFRPCIARVFSGYRILASFALPRSRQALVFERSEWSFPQSNPWLLGGAAETLTV